MGRLPHILCSVNDQSSTRFDKRNSQARRPIFMINRGDGDAKLAAAATLAHQIKIITPLHNKKRKHFKIINIPPKRIRRFNVTP